ncbi:YheC/YheD family endospore coat-associated protein [Neobacillus drentensis]|uniref:YheC/YheD family endospore coat-associated protein n=1 Tax=Neobacillus drentensis TaxID=220684 RepID=UPI0030008510
MSVPLIPITMIPTKIDNENKYLLQMSDTLVAQLQLNKGQLLKVTIGQKTITMYVQQIAGAVNELFLSESTLKEFHLPIRKFTLQAMYQPDNQELTLGPIIGLLTNLPSTNTSDIHFRSIHAFCEELHQEVTERGGFIYVFTYDQPMGQGYYFENGKWTLAKLPLPNVIYNRIHSRRLEKQKSYLDFRQRLEQLMIPLFNDRFLSKWEIYEHVKEENQLTPFIPETKLFSKDHLKEFAKKYQTIFLKPIHGSQGRNIIKIIKNTEENHYTLQTSLSVPLKNLLAQYTIDEIYQLLKPILNNRIYIIQQGIDLFTHNSCAVDFRVLCHKNLNDNWKVTSTVARIAAEQEFVSNIARGGTITRPIYALQNGMTQKKAVEAITLMKELAIETASVISRHTEGLFGELGIDIGIDQAGKPWLIEVNSKPSKNFEDGLGKIRPSAKAIIQFCTELAFDFAVVKEDFT